MTVEHFRTIQEPRHHWHSCTIRQNGTDLYAHDRAGFWAVNLDGHLHPVNPMVENTLRAMVARIDPWGTR